MENLKQAISLVFRDDENKVFVVRRALHKNTFPGCLSLPAMNLKERELFKDAANRLVQNKLGLKSVKISTEPLEVSPVVERPENMLKMFDYLVEERVGEFLLNPSDYIEGKWMSSEDLLKVIQAENDGVMGECTRNFLRYEGLL